MLGGGGGEIPRPAPTPGKKRNLRPVSHGLETHGWAGPLDGRTCCVCSPLPCSLCCCCCPLSPPTLPLPVPRGLFLLALSSSALPSLRPCGCHTARPGPPSFPPFPLFSLNSPNSSRHAKARKEKTKAQKAPFFRFFVLSLFFLFFLPFLLSFKVPRNPVAKFCLVIK